MPGFNGTGPRGMGPMTGRGRGYCLSYVGEGVPGPWTGRGVGRGRRHRYYATGQSCWAGRAPGRLYQGSLHVPPEGIQQELDFLKEQVNSLEEALEQAKKRIGELEGKQQ